MVQMFPDSEKTRVIFTSRAEEYFYNQCRSTLSSGWRVYYSVTLSMVEQGEGLRDNEIDFVCYHPKFGIVVIEVKGGRISFDADKCRFSSINRHGESFLIKDPFQQALVWKSRFLRLLRKKGIKVPVTHSVCFPSVSEDEIPPTAGIEPTIVIGRRKISDLDQALKTIVMKTQPERYLDFKDIGEQLDGIVVGSTFTSKLYLRDYLDGNELRMKDVETIHETLVTPIASSSRLGIEGEAGTGKTMLALMLARNFRDQGKSVLLLSSNSLLNLLLKRDAGPNIDVHTYPELGATFGVNLLIPDKEFEGTKEDWIQYEAPDRLKKSIDASERRYQVIICDEGQDVQPFWWDAVEDLFLEDDEDSRFFIFFDSSQGVFGSGGESKFVAEDSLPIAPPYFPLVHNYRTTREIAAFSRAFRTGDSVLQSHCGRMGYVPEILVYEDHEDCRRILGRLFRKLIREEDLTTDEITVLSARNPAARNTALYRTESIARIQLHNVVFDKQKSWRERFVPKGKIAVSTVARFKGLETPVGILLNISEYNLPIDNPLMASLIYVACTRAKHMLYIMVQRDDPKRKASDKTRVSHNSLGELYRRLAFSQRSHIVNRLPNEAVNLVKLVCR